MLKDLDYMPASLGGAGDFSLCFIHHPYTDHAPQVKEYILVLMGFHLGGVFTHFLGTRRNDFIEMALHHTACIILYGGCYLFSLWEPGAVIAFCHDIADITTCITKTLAETRAKTSVAVLFLFHMFIWFYTRCLVFPTLIWGTWSAPTDLGGPIVKITFCLLLSFLAILHYFWFSLFVKILMKFVREGSTEDE